MPRIGPTAGIRWRTLGAVIGALVLGHLTDLLGRKKLFTVTLGLYLVSAFLTALSWNFWSFALFRFFTGAGSTRRSTN